MQNTTTEQPPLANAAPHWVRKAPLPVELSEVSVIAVNGNIHVIGGTMEQPDGSTVEATTGNWMYDPQADRWSARAPLPWASSHVGLAELGGKIYAISGFTGIVHIGAQSEAHVYDPQADRWSPLPNLPTARGSVCMAAANGKIHVFGGRLSDKELSFPVGNGHNIRIGLNTVTTHDVFDPATGAWSLASPLPGPSRDHMGIAVLDGRIHIFGGRINDYTDMLDRHDIYDPQTDSWSTGAPLLEKRSAGAFTVLRGQILYAGGECRPGGRPSSPDTFDETAAYDPKTDRWTALPPLPHGRHGFGAATVGDIAYFAAGSPRCGGGGSSEMLALVGF